MLRYRIGDTLLIDAETTNASGNPADADALPVYSIYEMTDDAAIVTGTFAKRDDANTDGQYRTSVSLTLAAGFEAGKTYKIRKVAIIGGATKAAQEQFQIEAAYEAGAAVGDVAPMALTDSSLLTEIKLRVGEKRVLAAQEETTTGNLTVSAGGTFTLYDPEANVVAGFPVSVTGFTANAAPLVQAWYNLDTAALTPGLYVGYLLFEVTASQDGATRHAKTGFLIEVLPNVEVQATYDRNAPTSDKDRIRRYVADTEVSRAVWSDGEIAAYLSEEDNVFLAAAQMLQDASVDAARQAKIISLGTDKWDRTKIGEQLAARAKELQQKGMGLAGGYIESPDRIFTTDSEDGTVLGTMTGW